jgi:hypothetical protein
MSSGSARADSLVGWAQRRAVQSSAGVGDGLGVACAALALGDATGPASDGGADAVGADVATPEASEGSGVGEMTGAASPQPTVRTPTIAIAMSCRARIIPPL